MSNKKLIPYTIISFCLILTVFSNAAQSAAAGETLSVTVVTPSKTTLTIGEGVQLVAQASGGPGVYDFQWYSNDTAILDATWTPYTFTPTQIGSYNIKCVVRDDTGLITDPATSSTVLLTVTETPIVTSPTPTTSDPVRVGNPTDSGKVDAAVFGDLGLLLTAVFTVVVIAVVIAFLAMRHRGSKKTSNS